MIKIANMNIPISDSEDDIKQKAAKKLGLSMGDIKDFALAKLSVDARKKSDVHYVCALSLSCENEESLVLKAADKNVSLFVPDKYSLPAVTRKSSLRPVVVGMGPAGLFAALQLARMGLAPIILERGRSVSERTEDVERFWETAELSQSSNVQFGEGGAGTFSDGKLSTGTNDPRISHVFSDFVAHGAPADILWSNKPHIGTDLLRDVVVSIRRELISLGCDIRFENTLTGLTIHDKKLTALKVSSKTENYELPCDALVLAPGHSARDTFKMLFEAGLPMEQKPFAVGVRIEHRQEIISATQYGAFAEKLPPADYKLACHLPNGRSAFSFCVCPGGRVIAAASEPNRLVINGMSLRARDEENINGGFLVGVGPGDFEGDHPLAGLEFQAEWEKRAFSRGGSNYCAPVQTVGDFLKGTASTAMSAVTPSYKPGVRPGDLRRCLPKYITDTLAGALPAFERSLHGFSDKSAVLTGVETRSSSPVRILRGENFQSPIEGIYPCGEGAGYAGGITSAAVDGIKVAEKIAVN
ncbi:MAG: hypothetical protein RSD48_00515 [Oscillospiraceae bacterium]